MPSVADGARAQTIARVLELSVEARIALALALGDQDLDLFSRTNDLERSAALRHLKAGRARGRRRSSVTASGS